MSNQQNNNIPLDDDIQGSQQRPRNFYRKRPGLKFFFFCNYLFIFKLIVNEIGNERQNQDLGEDENRASNDDDTQRSNNSEENNNQANNDDNANNTRGIFIT